MKIRTLISIGALCLFASCGKYESKTVSDILPDYTGTICTEQLVDMGVSVLWAGYNVGATAPEGLGSYFAWGETADKGDGSNYNALNYKFHEKNPNYDGSDNYEKMYLYTKYCKNANNPGFDYNVLQSEDDAATVNWGNGWRTPTFDEFIELANVCTFTFAKYKGVIGLVWTSNINGNSLFFPSTDSKSYSKEYYQENCGAYWTANIVELSKNPYAHYVRDIWWNSTGTGGFNASTYHECRRFVGLTIRAVKDK